MAERSLEILLKSVWNSTITVPLAARMVGMSMVLTIELLGFGFLSTKPIGSVVVDLTDIMQEGAGGAGVKAEFNDHKVILPTGEAHGTMSFALHLKESKSLLAAAQRDQEAQATPEILE